MIIRCGDLAHIAISSHRSFMSAQIASYEIFMIVKQKQRPERMRSPDTKQPFSQGIGETSPTSKIAQVLPGHCSPISGLSSFLPIYMTTYTIKNARGNSKPGTDFCWSAPGISVIWDISDVKLCCWMADGLTAKKNSQSIKLSENHISMIAPIYQL